MDEADPVVSIHSGHDPVPVHAVDRFARAERGDLLRVGDDGQVFLPIVEEGGIDDVLGAAWVRNTWTPELRADGWAGCVFAKSGTVGSELAAALATLAKYPAASHPPWKIRLPVIRAGYTGCGGDGARISLH